MLRYYYQGRSYPKREFELIDRYWAKLKLKMSKNQEKISENLTGLHALVRARTSNFLEITFFFSVKLLKNDDRQGKRSKNRT